MSNIITATLLVVTAIISILIGWRYDFPANELHDEQLPLKMRVIRVIAKFATCVSAMVLIDISFRHQLLEEQVVSPEVINGLRFTTIISFAALQVVLQFFGSWLHDKWYWRPRKWLKPGTSRFVPLYKGHDPMKRFHTVTDTPVHD